jgi:hypothetical protein
MAGDIKIDLQGLQGLVTGGASAFKTVVETIKGKATLDPKDQAILDQAILEHEAKMQELEQAIPLAMIELNKIDAASKSLFQSGWRPFIGWGCGVGIVAYYPVRVVLGMGFWCWACIQKGELVPMPDLGIMDLIGLVSSMMGFGYFRTREKEKGVASS